jgi:hypothetical protein
MVTLAAAAVAALGMAGAASCHSLPRASTEAVDPFRTADSFRDSLARLVPLDSLRHLYLNMQTAEDPKPIARESVCELLRLGYVHGTDIVTRANRRLSDSLNRSTDPKILDRMSSRLAGASGDITEAGCHLPVGGPKAPDSLNLPPPVFHRRP